MKIYSTLYKRVREEFTYKNGNLYWAKAKAGRRMWQPAGRVAKRYREVMLDGVRYATHHLVWLWHTGDLPTMLDHINRRPEDNRIENLRLTDCTTNEWNKIKPRHNTSGHKHIHWESARSRWVGVIISDGVMQRKRSVNLNVVIDWRDKALLVRGEFNPIDKEIEDVVTAGI